MMRKVFGALAAVAALSASSVEASAQNPFVAGYTDIGPTVGLGGIGDAGLSLGGRFERGIKPLPSLGNGMLGIMVSVEYYSWDNAFFKYTYMPIGVTANYHFNLEGNAKLDPFVGLGLGYEVISCDYKGSGLDDLCDDSAIYFIGRAGARYFFSPRMAFYGDVGAGAATLNVGIMFKLR
jgi:hypothetical protein